MVEARAARRGPADVGDRVLLVVLAVWSLIPLLAGVLHVIRHGGSIAGVDGIGALDHFQYLAWVREASEHVLISNRFDVDADPAVYLQPMWAASGLVAAVTGSVQIGYLLLKPLCVAVLFGGFAAYVRRALDGKWERLAALALALFYFPPVTPFLHWAGIETDGKQLTELFGFELSPATYLWGYFQTAMAVGLMPVFLLAAERALDPDRGADRRRPVVIAALAGLLVAWVHPWQGIVLLAIVAGVVAWDRAPRRLLALALPIAGTLAPLVYFFALSTTDTAWNSDHLESGLPHYWQWVAAALAPLAILAAVGAFARRPLRDLGLQDKMLLIWPVATLAVYALAGRSFYYHLLSGLTLPLAVLAARAPGALRVRPALATAAAAATVGLLTLPGLAHVVDTLRKDIDGGALPRYLEPGEAEAMQFLDDSERPGPVLSRLYLGAAVPALSGRRTYVGHPSWTPDFSGRVDRTEALFAGRMTAAGAQALTRSSGASYVLADCRDHPDLQALLGPAVVRVRAFGCATVYELR